MELAQAGISAVSAVCEEGGVSELEFDWAITSCVCPPGERLCFPEDHWSDADAVLEDGH